MTTAKQPQSYPTNPVEIIFFKPDPEQKIISGLPYEDYTGMSNDEFMAGREPLYTKERQEELIDQLYFWFTKALRAGVECRFERSHLGSLVIWTPEGHSTLFLNFSEEWAWTYTEQSFYKENIEKLESLIGYFKVATI